jgi:hypothetical protein
MKKSMRDVGPSLTITLAKWRSRVSNIQIPHFVFFTAMLRLREDLDPTFAVDEYGQVVIRPLFQLVWAWVRAKSDSMGLPPDEFLKQRMSDFPRYHELITFFETQPEISGQRASGLYEFVPGIVPWFYKTLAFTIVRDAIEVRCAISPSLRQLVVRLAIAYNEVFYADVELAGKMRLQITPDRKVLMASVHQKDDFALQIEPHPRVAW